MMVQSYAVVGEYADAEGEGPVEFLPAGQAEHREVAAADRQVQAGLAR
jgi:hypothetical protein